MKRFLESHPEFPRAKGGVVLNQNVTNILTRNVYAGYVEAPTWGVTLRKGQHEALINFETYTRIQERLSGKAKAPARKGLDIDFPLRGAVACGHCGTPLTACWSTGEYARYPYYLCPKRGCASYGKSIRREKLEREFESLLTSLRPSENVFRAARSMFEDLWNHRLATSEANKRTLQTELAKIERRVEQFLDRIAEAQMPSVIAAYENRIRDLEEQKIVVTEKIADCGRPLKSFDEALRTALDFLANPWNLWTSPRLEDKRTVLKLAFADRLSYVRDEGFRTATPALPFKVLADFRDGKVGIGAPEGRNLKLLRSRAHLRKAGGMD